MTQISTIIKRGQFKRLLEAVKGLEKFSHSLDDLWGRRDCASNLPSIRISAKQHKELFGGCVHFFLVLFYLLLLCFGALLGDAAAKFKTAYENWRTWNLQKQKY